MVLVLLVHGLVTLVDSKNINLNIRLSKAEERWRADARVAVYVESHSPGSYSYLS